MTRDDEEFWHDVEADYLRRHPDRADVGASLGLQLIAVALILGALVWWFA